MVFVHVALVKPIRHFYALAVHVGVGSLQTLLTTVLFSPLVHGMPPSEALTEPWLVPVPPDRRRRFLATSHGLLTNELRRSSLAIVQPLVEQCERVAGLCSGDFDSDFAHLLVFFVRTLVALQGYCMATRAEDCVDEGSSSGSCFLTNLCAIARKQRLPGLA